VINPFGSGAFGIAKFGAVTSTIRNGFTCGTIRFVMDWSRIRMIGHFKGQSIFCRDRQTLQIRGPWQASGDVPGSRLLPTYRTATLQSGSPQEYVLDHGKHLGTFPGAACCQPTELPRFKAAPLQKYVLDHGKHQGTLPGAACCQAAEELPRFKAAPLQNTRWTMASVRGRSRGAPCCRATEELPRYKAAPLQALGLPMRDGSYPGSCQWKLVQPRFQPLSQRFTRAFRGLFRCPNPDA
jgi:hypothetical protein